MMIVDRVGMVSPKYGVGNLYTGHTEDRINVYEDRWQGWFFDAARQLLTTGHGDMAALLLTLAYFESYWIFRTGESSESRSKEFFIAAFAEIFPPSDWTHRPDAGPPASFHEDIARFLYKQLRCGLFHEGQTKPQVWVSRQREGAIEIAGGLGFGEEAHGGAIVNPDRFLGRVERHCTSYVATLREAHDGSDVRVRFNAAWELMKPPFVFTGTPPST